MTSALFLDIDGVLNSVEFYKRWIRQDRVAPPISAEALLCVNEICARGKPDHIVLSSSWRKENSLGQMQRFLASFGFTYRLTDATPILDLERGDEIGAWLAHHNDVSSFAILDDDADMGPLVQHLVQTSAARPIGANEVARAIALLTGKPAPELVTTR